MREPPRWTRTIVIALLLLALLIVVVMLVSGGGHRPVAHAASTALVGGAP